MSKNIKTRIQNKHDLEVNWLLASNFIPLQGELVVYDIEVDAEGNTLTKDANNESIILLPADRTTPYTYERFKIGDGIHTINELPFTTEPYYTKPETNDAILAAVDGLISCGQSDPDANTTSQFYFKYSTE